MLRGFLASSGPCAAAAAAAFLGRAPPLLGVPSRGRKSRSDPPAKSKAGRIKTPPPVDPAELLVVTERYRQYRRTVSAIRWSLCRPDQRVGLEAEMGQSSHTPTVPTPHRRRPDATHRYWCWRLTGLAKRMRAEFKEDFLRQQYEEKFGQVGKQREDAAAEEHRRLMAWNDAENKRLQERREERLQKEETAERERRLRGAEHQATLMEEFIKEKEKEVLQLQEEAKSFITPENLDQRIEECLNNPRNYNYAIDKEGRIAKRSILP